MSHPHPSGDTKPCLTCGKPIVRQFWHRGKKWEDARYCGAKCSSPSGRQKRVRHAICQAEKVERLGRWAAAKDAAIRVRQIAKLPRGWVETVEEAIARGVPVQRIAAFQMKETGGIPSRPTYPSRQWGRRA